jgi:general secretion pathway protein G
MSRASFLRALPMRLRAFTLVEILIVVVILGILGSIVVPQFASATTQAKEVATLEHLGRLRRALAIYYVRNNAMYPGITEGTGTWGELIRGGYLKAPGPVNDRIEGDNRKMIVFGTAADTEWTEDYGWIFDPATGNAWAATFDAEDRPIPRP